MIVRELRLPLLKFLLKRNMDRFSPEGWLPERAGCWSWMLGPRRRAGAAPAGGSGQCGVGLRRHPDLEPDGTGVPPGGAGRRPRYYLDKPLARAELEAALAWVGAWLSSPGQPLLVNGFLGESDRLVRVVYRALGLKLRSEGRVAIDPADEPIQCLVSLLQRG